MDKLKPSRGQAISVAAHLARGTRLKAIRDLCEDQRTVSTGKLEFMADNLADCMKSDAILIRELSDYAEATDTALAAAEARIAELDAENKTLKKLAEEDAQRISDLNQQFYASNARCRELEKALEPFAALDEPILHESASLIKHLPVTQVRRAAALLKEPTND